MYDTMEAAQGPPRNLTTKHQEPDQTEQNSPVQKGDEDENASDRGLRQHNE